MALLVQYQARQVQRLLVHQCFGLEGAGHQRRLQDGGPPVHLLVLVQKWLGLRADC